MKKQFRILAAALALCLSLLCCPAAFAAVDSSSCQTVPYAQATSQPLGQPITITGTPNYSAATSNDTAEEFLYGLHLHAVAGDKAGKAHLTAQQVGDDAA